MKTRRDEATGRARSEPVGSVSLKTGEINARALENLTKDEIAEVEAWIDRKRRLERKRKSLGAHYLPLSIHEAIDWMETGGQQTDDDLVEEILNAMRAFQKAARRRKQPPRN